VQVDINEYRYRRRAGVHLKSRFQLRLV